MLAFRLPVPMKKACGSCFLLVPPAEAGSGRQVNLIAVIQDAEFSIILWQHNAEETRETELCLQYPQRPIRSGLVVKRKWSIFSFPFKLVCFSRNLCEALMAELACLRPRGSVW